MEKKGNAINTIDEKSFIKSIQEKYNNNNNIKIIGKKLHYIKSTTILQFYCTIYKLSDINPFSSDIILSVEFINNSCPYVHILNDFINPTLNDGRNIFYCLTNKHSYCFNKNKLGECELLFEEIITGIKNFLLCLKENIQINVFIYYGEYEIGHTYQINDFLINKNTIKFYRIIQINGKNEELKYIVITQLFYLLFQPLEHDMSLAKLEQWFYLKDINFALNEITLNKKGIKTCYFLKILSNYLTSLSEFEFCLFTDDTNNVNNNHEHNKYKGFQNVLISKKNEIDLKKYKIIISNYKPLFAIENKKNNQNKSRVIINMYNDYKLYIAYFEELYNYYKDFKEEKIKNRVKTYLGNLTFFLVDFITFYDSNPEEVKFYQSKMLKYLKNDEI